MPTACLPIDGWAPSLNMSGWSVPMWLGQAGQGLGPGRGVPSENV